FAGDEINHRPIDQIGLYDRGNAAQRDRGSKVAAAGGSNRDGCAQDHDRDLDVASLSHSAKRGKKLAITSPDKSATTKQPSLVSFNDQEIPTFCCSAGITAATWA